MKLRIPIVLVLFFFPFFTQAQTPCVDGLAGEYPCQNIDLLSRLTTDDLMAEEQQGVLVNDIWGWTDPETGHEYAIVGMANGTSFVDVTDPINPIMLGILPEHEIAETAGRAFHDGAKSIWRDIKVYKDHAYIVSEDRTHGIQIFDLRTLRDVDMDNIPETFPESGHYPGLSNSHNIVINEATGYAYAVGSTGQTGCSSGGLHVINIQDPINPVYEGCFDDDGYTHDAQCVIYEGPDSDYTGKEICFNSNGNQGGSNTLTIVDVDDKENMTLISKAGYEASSYAHQGWLTEDHAYFIANDELDELGFNSNTKTFIWDVRDLDNPIMIGIYEHTTKSIDHNLYILDEKIYQSNYTSGLRILDGSDVADAHLVEMAYFDTYPTSEGVTFFGTWSNYPYFESGNIIVSDITNGLFVLRPNMTNNYIVKQPESVSGCEEEHFDVGIEVGGEGQSYRWQLDDGQGGGFEDITDYESYQNTNSDSLHIHSVTLPQNGYQFRCKITPVEGDVVYSDVVTLSLTMADFTYGNGSSNVQFTNTSTAATSYEWDFGDGSTLSNLESPSHTFEQGAGSYEVTLTAKSDCGTNVFTQTVNVTLLSVDEIEIGGVNIYPIPNTGMINFRNESSKSVSEYSIQSLSGKKLLSGVLHVGEGTIDTHSLSAGIYMINFKMEDGSLMTRKLRMK